MATLKQKLKLLKTRKQGLNWIRIVLWKKMLKKTFNIAKMGRF